MTAPSPLATPARRLNLSPLTEPIDDSALKAFIADSKATGKPWRRITTGHPRPSVGTIIGGLIPVVIPLAGLSWLLYVGGRELRNDVWEFTQRAPFPFNLLILGFFGLIVIGILVALIRTILLIRSLIIPRSWWEAAYRLTRLAAANGLQYGHDDTVSYPGVIFDTGTGRTAERRLTTTAGRRVEIANYRYTIAGDDNERVKVYGWGYVAITLDRRLPNLLLDAKANDKSVFGIRTSNLPIELARGQRLTLGGEFDDKFTLYAPSDYGRDAFYIFAPDLMALFIDRLGTFDVEIVDDTMFLYGSRFDLLNPRTYEWLQELVDTVVARTVRRTGRYTDDFALLQSDPASSRTPVAAAAMDEPAARTGENAPFQLIPGLPLGGPARPQSSPTPTEQSGQIGQPVFEFAGDGPPQAATNTIAEKGRRLRRRRWGLWSVVALLMVAFYVYNEYLGPWFGLPVLHR